MQPEIYEILPAAPDISAFVRRYMYADAQEPIDATMKPAPNGFGYIGQIFRGEVRGTIDGGKVSRVSGFHFTSQIDNRDFEFRFKGRFGHIMAEVYPTTCYRLFGLPLGTLKQLAVSWSDLLDPKLTKELTGGLLAATTREERQAAFDDVFRKMLPKARSEVPKIDAAVKIIDQAEGRILITDLCDQLSITERTLSRNFKHIVGLSPKYYARSIQMNIAVEKLFSNDHEQLAKLSHECGFFDQSHFIKTMREFFERSPSEYLNSNNHMFHLFIGRKSRE